MRLDGLARLSSLGLCLLEFVTQEDEKLGDLPSPFALLTLSSVPMYHLTSISN